MFAANPKAKVADYMIRIQERIEWKLLEDNKF